MPRRIDPYSRPPLRHMRWLAGVDRVAHAELSRGLRTLCDRTRTPERFAWPAAARCLECQARVADLEREVAMA